jgi:hypothetical protein
MKKLPKLKGVKILNYTQQKSVHGGQLIDCPSGCFSLFFQGPGNRCAIPGFNGTACFGTIQNGQCCM